MDLLKYSEDSGVSRVENVRRAHLSIELGHFHLREFTGKSSGEIEILLQRQLVRAAPLGEVIRQTAICGTSTPRVSTCFLLDDYFGDDVLEPESILVPLLKVADELGIRIDYVGREAACAVTRDGVKLGEIVAGMVQGEPPRGTTGARPPAQDSGWLCNGERAQNEAMAMRLPATRQFPEEYGIDTKNSHSIFVDIEMWRDPAPGRKSEPGRR